MEPIFGFDTSTSGYSVVSAAIDPGDEGLCWHPLVLEGQHNHPVFGPFEITERHSSEYLAAFAEGVPGPGGIPIDERGDHGLNAGGAFGWIEKMRRGVVSAGGRTWQATIGGISWTPMGKQLVEDRTYKFLSPHWYVDSPSNVYGRPNVIFAAALCTRPFFWQQPELTAFAAAQSISLDELRSMRDERAAKWGIVIRPDGRLTPAAHYREHASRPQDYADPVNLKYPLQPVEHRVVAAAHFAQSFDRYPEDSRRVVYSRIVRSLKQAGMKHRPNPSLDPLLPPDLRAWAQAG